MTYVRSAVTSGRRWQYLVTWSALMLVSMICLNNAKKREYGCKIRYCKSDAWH